MENISLNSEPLKLGFMKTYYVIDALYLNDVRDGLSVVSIKDIDAAYIKKNIFPYVETPFAEFEAQTTEFNINRIQKITDSENSSDDNLTAFSTDTGLLIVINREIFLDFFHSYDYYQLINSEVDFIDKNYWKFITSKYSLTDIGLILAPGINSGFDFEGSGIYKIV